MASISPAPNPATTWNPRSAYENWMASTGLPVYRGHYVENLSTVELGWWAERECNGAFLYFQGMVDIHESRVIEIPPGKTLPPTRLGMEELVYVVGGRGLCTIWGGDNPRRTFEWGPHAIFMVPPNYTYQLSNAQGAQPARVLATNLFPLALTTVPNVDYFFNNPTFDASVLYGDNANPYAEAIAARPVDDSRGNRSLWIGNFFPDMAVWDKLEPNRGRGAGGSSVYFRSPTGKSGHMSVFAPRRYKMAHRHGPGRVIVIPAGQGYSQLWPPGGEKETVFWQEGTVFTPPNQWYHQHFNLGDVPGRYLALAPPNLLNGHFRLQETGEQQTWYPDEDPSVRAMYEDELAKRGLVSDIPAEAYQDRNYKWDYGDDDD